MIRHCWHRLRAGCDHPAYGGSHFIASPYLLGVSTGLSRAIYDYWHLRLPWRLLELIAFALSPEIYYDLRKPFSRNNADHQGSTEDDFAKIKGLSVRAIHKFA